MEEEATEATSSKPEWEWSVGELVTGAYRSMGYATSTDKNISITDNVDVRLEGMSYSTFIFVIFIITPLL